MMHPGGNRTTEPVTAGQAAMFFAEQKSMSDCAYNVTTVVDVTGAVTRDDLFVACRRLAASTAALRLRMGIDDWTGEVVHRFAADEPEIELCDAPGADAATVRDLIDRNTRRPFETDEGPLARFMIVRTGPEQAHLAVVTHHLTVDGASHVPLARRFGHAIAGPVNNDTEADYNDLIRWICAAEERARVHQREYWHRRIPYGFAPAAWRKGEAHAAPTDGCSLTPLPEPTVRRLKVAASTCGVRLFHLLTAAVHHSLPVQGHAPSVVCAATSIRPREAHYDSTIGCFINEVPLLAEQRSRASIAELAIAEAPRWAADLRQRHFPFMDLAGRAAPPANSPMRLDSVMVSYRKGPRRLAWREGDIQCAVDLYPRYLDAKTELVVRFFHDGDRMECEVQWGRDTPAGLGAAFRSDLLAALHHM